MSKNAQSETAATYTPQNTGAALLRATSVPQLEAQVEKCRIPGILVDCLQYDATWLLLKSVKQFAGGLTKGWVVILPVQAVAENIIWTVRRRRIVNFFYCAV